LDYYSVPKILPLDAMPERFGQPAEEKKKVLFAGYIYEKKKKRAETLLFATPNE